MDDKIINLRKVIFEKPKLSDSEVFTTPRKRLFTDDSLIIPNKVNDSIDLDKNELEATHDSYNTSLSEIGNTKLEYRNKLISNLQMAKNKLNNEIESPERKSKYNRNYISIRNDVAKSVETHFTNLDQSDVVKSKTNYRTICDEMDSKNAKDSFGISNKLNSSGFLSLSRQSLNDNLNESGISNTASRISGNILKRSFSQRKDISNESISNSVPTTLPCKAYSLRNRRYRTIVKKDKFSSYLMRVSQDDNVFSIPSQINNKNVSLNINLTEMSEKRVDFSKIMRFSNEKMLDKTDCRNVIDNNWNCSNCDSSNPSNFNFCPTCSASNPKLLLLKDKHFNQFDENDPNNWICSRCSTKNDAIRIVCIFCFQNKSALSECKKHFAKKPKLSTDSDENKTDNKNEKNQFKNNEIDVVDKQISIADDDKNINNDVFVSLKSIKKWSCPTCLVDNDSNVKCCPCCMTKNPSSNDGTLEFESSNNDKNNNGKPLFLFGLKNDDNKTTFKFGTGDVSNKKWACPTCLVENNDDVDCCPCCMTTNPSKTIGSVGGSSQSTTLKFATNNEQNNNGKPLFVFGSKIDDKNVQKSTFKFGTGDASNKKWACPTCLVDNNDDVDCCPCCMTTNPSKATGNVGGSSQSTSLKFATNNVQNNNGKPLFVFGSKIDDKNVQKSTFKFGTGDASNKKWACPTCLVENNDDVDCCPCCMTKKPSNVNKISFANQQTSVTNSNQCNNKWTCDTCLVESNIDVESCPCCMTRNPLIKASNIGIKQPTTFSFGAKHDDNIFAGKPVFKFGVQSNSNDGQKSTFKFGTQGDSDKQQSTFKFGTQGDSDKQQSTFKFGTQSDSDNQKSTFKFGTESENNKKLKDSGYGKWSCPTCLVENSLQMLSCPCCMTKNTSLSQPMPIQAPSASDKVDNDDNISQSNWICSTCLVENKYSQQRCVCCQGNNHHRNNKHLNSPHHQLSPANSSFSQSLFQLNNSSSFNVSTKRDSAVTVVSSSDDSSKAFLNNSIATMIKNSENVSKNSNNQQKSSFEGHFQFGISNGNVANNSTTTTITATTAIFGGAQCNNSETDKIINTAFQFDKVASNKNISNITTENGGDNELYYAFSQPETLGVSICVDVPVDLVFEFSDPLRY